MLYKYLLRPLMFQMDPESAHNFAASMMGNPLAIPGLLANKMVCGFHNPMLRTHLCGIPLENPVGLAAGFDKNAHMYSRLHHLGFAFVEIGTCTAHAQPGNPKPRLFRLPEDQAIINRMGFNNEGTEAVARRLQQAKAQVPLGGNIGKSKITELDDAISDYETSFKLLQPLVDYFVVNVSSPNTPNLRQLQEKKPLADLLNHLMGLNAADPKPLLLKIAPDLNEHQLGDIVEVAEETGIQGVIATNTTISRDGLSTPKQRVEEIGAGGLSGRPVHDMSNEVLKFLRRNLPEKIELVGVGGIFNGEDAYRKIKAGARTVQVYTGFVYGGPNMVNDVNRELTKLLKRDGFKNLEDAVGADL